MSETARTYNQNHVPRPYTPGRRRVSVYVSWSYPAEANRNPAELDNRFSTMTEVRRVALAGLRGPALVLIRCASSRASPGRWSCSSGRGCRSSSSSRRSPAIPCRCSSASTRPVSRCRWTSGCWTTPTPCSSSAWTTWSPGRRPRPAEIEALRRFLAPRGHLPGHRTAPRRGRLDDLDERDDRVPPSRRRAGAAPAALRPLRAWPDAGARDSGGEPLRAAARPWCRDDQARSRR